MDAPASLSAVVPEVPVGQSRSRSVKLMVAGKAAGVSGIIPREREFAVTAIRLADLENHGGGRHSGDRTQPESAQQGKNSRAGRVAIV